MVRKSQITDISFHIPSHLCISRRRDTNDAQVREPDKEGYVEGIGKLNLHQSEQRLSAFLFGMNVE